MAVTAVGSVSHSEAAGTSATISVARTGITAGNTIVVGVIGQSFQCNQVDDGTTTISTATGQVNQASLSKFLSIWTFPNHAGGDKTFTATFANAATSTRAIVVLELQGAVSTSPVEGTATQATGFDAAGAISTSAVSPAPTVDGEYIVAYAMTDNGAITARGSYTSLFAETTVNDSCFEGFAQGSHAAVTGDWTLAATGSWGAVVASYKPAALTSTFYLNNPIQGSSNSGLLDTAVPTASTSTTGWTVGTNGVNQYSRVSYNAEVSAGNFTATAQPSGTPVNLAEDCFRLSAITTGQFSAGTWYSSLSVIAVSSGGIQQGRGRFRIYRSANADGTGATELTQGTMIGSQVTELSTTVAQSSSASTFIAASNLTNEFLLLQAAWETL